MGALRLVSGGIMSIVKVEIDNELLSKARDYVGPMDANTLVQVAVTTLIQLKAGEWLAAQGGTQPKLADIPGRRV